MEGADLSQESGVRSHYEGQGVSQAKVGRAGWPGLVKADGLCGHRDKIGVRRQLWQRLSGHSQGGGLQQKTGLFCLLGRWPRMAIQPSIHPNVVTMRLMLEAPGHHSVHWGRQCLPTVW